MPSGHGPVGEEAGAGELPWGHWQGACHPDSVSSIIIWQGSLASPRGMAVASTFRIPPGLGASRGTMAFSLNYHCGIAGSSL